MKIKYTSNSPEITKKAGLLLAKILKPGDIILLSGELGAGKTVLISGVADGLGIKEDLTSPSFTILNIYNLHGKKRLVHADFYRLDNISEILNTGIEDYLYEKNFFICIEWGDKIIDYLRQSYLEIIIDYDLSDSDCRNLQFISNSRYWDKKLQIFKGSVIK
ncbi:MAG: tRNA (adenosine(37)-N6)-threonylcarbamoyltransferase complex ATPase subunit type 1 TsaE [Actinobacteria bacterium]|nr:tRNA (adenosine(37)-N6)-threonylcarbamoyltransferase complex ATPase subunit type 1 TsaE [Actinomycetota bacterium]